MQSIKNGYWYKKLQLKKWKLHYMIDILPPDASFSAYEFKKGRKIY